VGWVKVLSTSVACQYRNVLQTANSKRLQDVLVNIATPFVQPTYCKRLTTNVHKTFSQSCNAVCATNILQTANSKRLQDVIAILQRRLCNEHIANG
jgi:hypothetical protein